VENLIWFGVRIYLTGECWVDLH